MIRLSCRRVPKPSGLDPKQGSVEDSPNLEESDVENQIPASQDRFTKEIGERGPKARSMANRFTDKHDAKRKPEFVDNFSSSNIDGIAYDGLKKQLWVRFKDNSVYTYFNIPFSVYRGFISSPSKGHYFWEKIRRNKKIQYQKLTASLRWIPYNVR